MARTAIFCKRLTGLSLTTANDQAVSTMWSTLQCSSSLPRLARALKAGLDDTPIIAKARAEAAIWAPSYSLECRRTCSARVSYSAGYEKRSSAKLSTTEEKLSAEKFSEATTASLASSVRACLASSLCCHLTSPFLSSVRATLVAYGFKSFCRATTRALKASQPALFHNSLVIDGRAAACCALASTCGRGATSSLRVAAGEQTSRTRRTQTAAAAPGRDMPKDAGIIDGRCQLRSEGCRCAVAARILVTVDAATLCMDSLTTWGV
mmetsp:Transcript_36352/g.102690  ORF Transcript_36352/g.102690 Transcript_36352/m.102690 type:complete len:265 (-) Transcript_36352:30-824(-)